MKKKKDRKVSEEDVFCWFVTFFRNKEGISVIGSQLHGKTLELSQLCYSRQLKRRPEGQINAKQSLLSSIFFYCTLSYSVKHVEICVVNLLIKKSLLQNQLQNILWFTSFPSTIFGTNYFQLHAANYWIVFTGIGPEKRYENWRMLVYQLASSFNSSEKPQRWMCLKDCALPGDWHIVLWVFPFSLFFIHPAFPHECLYMVHQPLFQQRKEQG